MFEFRKDGRRLRLRKVFIITETSEDEGLLKGVLSKLINPIYIEKLKNLIRGTNPD